MQTLKHSFLYYSLVVLETLVLCWCCNVEMLWILDRSVVPELYDFFFRFSFF